MTDLRLRTRCEWWGAQTEVTDAAPDTLAAVAYTVTAVTLAEPLRRALDRHLAGHGCGTGNCADPQYISGFLNCPAARELWDLLPDGDRILMA